MKKRTIALAAELKLREAADGGESRTIDIEWKNEDARGITPIVEISGTNVSKIIVNL